MSRGPGLLFAVLLAGLLLATGGVRPVHAEDALAKARETFVKTRSTCDLVDAFEGVPARDEYTATDAQLALAACDRVVSPTETTETAYAALPAVIGALKRLDVEAASVAARRVGNGVAGGIGIWARALIAARRGRDAEAVAAILALPAVADADRPRASFALALFGAALPQDDRLLLAAMGRSALLEACQAGDVARIVDLGRSLGALDREVGTQCLCLAFRALRRLARHTEADRLVVTPEVHGHLAAHTCYLRERALALWRAGQPAQARDIAVKLAAAPPHLFVIEALRKPTAAIQAPSAQPAPVHLPASERHATTLARFATLLGRPTTAEDVVAAANAQTASLDDPTFAQSWLESLGFRVAPSAGSARAGEEALARKLPFLLFEIRLEDEVFLDTPVIVRARDPENGLWILEDTDLFLPDVRPADVSRKAWCLVAVPGDNGPAPEAFLDRKELLLGRAIIKALGLAARGELTGASAYLESQAVNLAGPAVFDLYRAFLYHRRFVETEDLTALQLAYEAAVGPVKVTPRLVFELVAEGQGLHQFDRKVPESLQRFDEAQRLAPHSAWLARTRGTLLSGLGQQRNALDALELARVLDPGDTAALYQRGFYRALRKEEKSGARGDLRRAFDRDPTSHEIALELARLEVDLRNPQGSLDVIFTYIEHVPEAASDDDVTQARFVAEALLVQAATTHDALEPFVTSPLPEIRRRVVYALARLDSAEAEATLRALLADANAAVRGTALRIYMRPLLRAKVASDPELGNVVVGLLHDDPSEIVRGAAAGLLGLIEQPYAIEELATALVGATRDSDPYPRSEAARALGRQGGATAKAALVDALSDPNVDVRKAGIEALFKIAFTYHGYDAEAPEAERQRAIERWLRWLGEPDSRERTDSRGDD